MVLLGYAALALVGMGSYVGYVVRPVLVLLPVGVLATSLAVPQLVADLTEGRLGADGLVTMSLLTLTTSLLIAWRLQEEHGR